MGGNRQDIDQYAGAKLRAGAELGDVEMYDTLSPKASICAAKIASNSGIDC